MKSAAATVAGAAMACAEAGECPPRAALAPRTRRPAARQRIGNGASGPGLRRYPASVCDPARSRRAALHPAGRGIGAAAPNRPVPSPCRVSAVRHSRRRPNQPLPCPDPGSCNLSLTLIRWLHVAAPHPRLQWRAGKNCRKDGMGGRNPSRRKKRLGTAAGAPARAVRAPSALTQAGRPAGTDPGQSAVRAAARLPQFLP